MCIVNLQNKLSLTKVLNESFLKAVCETEILEQTIDTTPANSFDDDLSSIDLNITGKYKATELY